MSSKSFARTTQKTLTHDQSIIMLVMTKHWEKTETTKTAKHDHFQIMGCDLFEANPETDLTTLSLADFQSHAADNPESHDEIMGYALLDLAAWKRLMPSTGERNTSEKDIEDKTYPILRLCEHRTTLDKALAEAGISMKPYSGTMPDNTEPKTEKHPANS